MAYAVIIGVFVYREFTWEKFVRTLEDTVVGIGMVMLIIVAMLLVVGMLMDSTVLILLLTAILIPIARAVGIDLVHFGIVVVLAAAVLNLAVFSRPKEGGSTIRIPPDQSNLTGTIYYDDETCFRL